MEAAVTNVRESTWGDRAAAINRALENLEEATCDVSMQIHDAAQATDGSSVTGIPAPEGATGDARDDHVIDVEFEQK